MTQENSSEDQMDKLAQEAWELYESKVMREARSAWLRLIVRKRQENKE